MRANSPKTLLIAMCAAEIGSMLGIATFPSLQPELIKLWGLSNTQVGWVNGVYFLAYLLAVPVLVSLTDRVPPRRIYAISMFIAGLSGFGFAWIADGFWSAMIFRAMGGIGLAGSYMPGLKLLSDHLEKMAPGEDTSRAVAFYTSSFGIGSALSYFFAGEIASAWGWQTAFVIAGVGPMVGLTIAYVTLPKSDPRPSAPDTHLLDFRPVLKCREAMGFVLAYTAHNFELFAMRAWIVSYLVFAAALRPSSESFIAATTIAAAVNLLGMPASVYGNEVARRIGRVRTIIIIMTISAAMGLCIGFSAHLPFWVVIGAFLVYGVTITADSSAITAGVVQAAPKGYKGATMAVHSSIGFMGSFLGPLAFGAMLDATGYGTRANAEDVMPWVAAFSMTALVLVLGGGAVAILSGKRS